MNNDSIEKSRSVIPHPPGISKEKSVVPKKYKKYKESDVLSQLSDEQLHVIEHNALARTKSKEDKERKTTYELGLLQLAGLIDPPKQYYTVLGEPIRNPTAYAKTGSPMYGSQKYLMVDLNQKTYIYKLYLEDGKIYIGKTNNLKRRMDEHFSGMGSKVTQKFKPLNYEILEVCDGYFSNKQEQYHTKKNIRQYGYENVRGGKHTNSRTLHKSQR